MEGPGPGHNAGKRLSRPPPLLSLLHEHQEGMLPGGALVGVSGWPVPWGAHLSESLGAVLTPETSVNTAAII